MGYAGGHKILTYLSWVLSVMSALLALVPFWYIWCIIHDILEVSPDFSQAENVTGYGWSAVLFAVISIVVYIAALMCSHLSAFRVAANIRKELMRHIAALPLGVTEKYGSGKLRRIVNGSSAATETYLAHRLPDKAGAIATPIGLFFLLLAFDWRLGLLSLVPVVLGFLIMMKMTGKDMEKRMEQYQNALADMSNEAVEYVRGVPVVKTFGQTIFSFKRFKNAIDNYETWVIAYTKGLRLPMMFYTTAINSVFAFLIAGGILFTRGGVTNELLLNLIFYIVITPVIGTTLTKIMFMSEDAMIVGDAINRINEVLNEKPLSESSVNNIPKDNGITLEHVSYSYDGKKNALNDVSLSIKPGQTVALVGSSGGGKTTMIRTMLGLIAPGRGRAFLRGRDGREVAMNAALRGCFSYVPQGNTMISGTVAENLRMVAPSASDEELERALRAACAWEFVEQMPDGLQAVVGERGHGLSEGQAQRIAIARALLRDAPVLLLDEATSALDVATERRVLRSLMQSHPNKTCIVTTHRPTVIGLCERVYQVGGGTVRELRVARDDALASGDGLGVRGVHVVDDALDHPVEILLLAAADLDAARRNRDPGRRLAALGRSPDSVADVLVLLVHQKTQHRGLNLGIELTEDEVAVRLRELPILLVVARVELQIDHELLRFEVPLRELILVLPVLSLGSVRAQGRRNVVLNDVAQLDGRKRVFVLDARLDVDEPLAEGVVALGRVGQQVLQDLAVIAVL